MAEVWAAGAVVLKRDGAVTRVALVHRPRYDDWSLPKGKLEEGESFQAAAVREIAEETGLFVRLNCPLDETRYELPDGDTKVVHWWRASVVAIGDHAPGEEVDQVRWVDVTQLGILTYDDEREVIAQALDMPTTIAFACLRHAKAMGRSDWELDDRLRPLAAKSEAQMEAIAPAVDAYGFTRIFSSPATRCMATIADLAAARSIPVLMVDELSEESGERPDGRVAEIMEVIVAAACAEESPTLVCGHRPLLPTMVESLGIASHRMSTAEVVLAHLDADGRAIAREVLLPKDLLDY